MLCVVRMSYAKIILSMIIICILSNVYFMLIKCECFASQDKTTDTEVFIRRMQQHQGYVNAKLSTFSLEF